MNETMNDPVDDCPEGTTHVVMYWHVPNDCEYDRARIVKRFFSNEKEANEFHQKNLMPPEMATLLTHADYVNLRQRRYGGKKIE